MKRIEGGISTNNNCIHIDLRIDGGQTQTRSYSDSIDSALTKLQVIIEALNALNLSSESDVAFYVSELSTLFASTHIDLLSGTGSYQVLHNISILSVYVQVCSKHFSDMEALQLLGCARMVRELNTDCGDQLGPPLDSNKFECNYTGPSNVIDAAQHLRQLVSAYAQLIQNKQAELQTAYQNIFGQIHMELSA